MYPSLNSTFLGPIKDWANCWRYLVYTLEEGSDESEYVHVVDMRETSLKVKNFGQDPLGNHPTININYNVVKFLSY